MSIFEKILDMFIALLRYLGMVKESEKDATEAELTRRQIQEKVEAVQNPPSSLEDPLGTEDWNAGK